MDENDLRNTDTEYDLHKPESNLDNEGNHITSINLEMNVKN